LLVLPRRASRQLDEFRPKNPIESSSTMSLRKLSTVLILSFTGVLLAPAASASPVSTGTRADQHRPIHRHGQRPAPKPKPKPQNAN